MMAGFLPANAKTPAKIGLLSAGGMFLYWLFKEGALLSSLAIGALFGLGMALGLFFLEYRKAGR